jgi:hypothetical protein
VALDDGKPACVAVAGADRDGDAVTFTVVTPPSSGRAFLVPGGCVLATGAANGPVGRGLHSSTFRLNVSALCGIGGAFGGCLGDA